MDVLQQFLKLVRISDIHRIAHACFFQSIADEVESEEKGRSWLDVDVLARAVFERLLMSPDELNKAVLLKEASAKTASHYVVEWKVVNYLSSCYFRLVLKQSL